MYTNIFFTDIPTHAHALTLPDIDCDKLSAFINAVGLSCPMPLLKLKLTLKKIPHGSIYLIASDKNSQIDLERFCTKNQLGFAMMYDKPNAHCATNYHFIITKNHPI